MTAILSPSNSAKRIHFRSLAPVDDYSPHFLAALQLLTHTVAPLRKVIVHFSLTSAKYQDELKLEWKFLQALGQLLKELASEGEETDAPVDPTNFYENLAPCLERWKKNKHPRDATEAFQILLEGIQESCQDLPVTNHLWSSLLDKAGLGIVAKQSIVGKSLLKSNEILQRTSKESCMEWCPLVLKHSASVEEAMKTHVSKQPYSYDFDEEGFDFEVRIPVMSPAQSKGLGEATTTTRTLQWTSVTNYLFLGIDRRKGEMLDASEMKIPHKLDIASICDTQCVKENSGNLKYELVAGVLHDDEDYVAIVKNQAETDPDSDDAWKLLESEEVIGMSQHDALDFLPGDGDESSPCGTMLVYRRCDPKSHVEMDSLLSDIIISQVRGSLHTKEFYYEEEVIE